jgi:cytochrome c biogenesis protein
MNTQAPPNFQQRTLELLASMPFAMSILILLSSVSVVGTLIAQNRGTDYYRSLYGDSWQQVIAAVNFDNVYHSWWFITLLVFLFLSLIAAVWRHGLRIWLQTRPLQQIPDTHTQAEKQLILESDKSEIDDDFFFTLRQKGYKHYLSSSSNNEQTFFFQKGRWGKLGFFPIHIGLVVIIIGSFVTSQWGFRGAMNIPENESSSTVYIQKGDSMLTAELPFSIKNNGFSMLYYDNGMPSSYQTDIEIIEDGKTTDRKSIFVNDPLSIGDINIYQASFGDAGSDVEFSITNLTKADFPIDKVNSAVYQILEDTEQGTIFTITELREHNVMNLSSDPLKKISRDVGPSLEIRIESPITGTITYRVYKSFPNMIAYTLLGDTEMTTFDLGISPSDKTLMAILSSYMKNLYSNQTINSDAINSDTRRNAFREALQENNIPMSKAKQLGPVIAKAAEALSKHKLPALFHFSDYQKKLYTGLQVSKDPGANIIWLGSIFLIVGLTMIYTSEKRIWIKAERHGNKLKIKLFFSAARKNDINNQYLMRFLSTEFTQQGYRTIEAAP